MKRPIFWGIAAGLAFAAALLALHPAHADDEPPPAAPKESLAEKVEDKVKHFLDVHIRHTIATPTKLVIDGSVACNTVGTELHCTARAAEAK